MKLPVQEINEGDIIFRNQKYYHIKSINENKEITAINIGDGTLDVLIPETNIFGMNYFVKIINLMSFSGNSTSNPMMMYVLSKMDDESESLDVPTILALTSMNGNMSDMFKNPMMLALLSKDKGSSNLPLLMMMTNGASAKKTKK
jgi:hypothetical protein